MKLPIEQAKAKLAEWVERHCRAVLYDKQNSTLLDVAELEGELDKSLNEIERRSS